MLLMLAFDTHAMRSIWDKASKNSGVPAVTIYAIALKESGVKHQDGRLHPWPWTLNSPKGSMRFKTKESAYDGIKKLIDSGERNIDLGLMQINIKSHWSSIKDKDILDPKTNIMAAAEILMGTMKESRGDIRKAVGLYHSHNTEKATNYEASVKKYELLLSKDAAFVVQ